VNGPCMGALFAAIGGILGETLGRRADRHMRGEVGGGESGQERPFCLRYKATIELGAALGSAPRRRRDGMTYPSGAYIV
jgi:hypothetical protein